VPLSVDDVYILDSNLPYGWGGKDFDAVTGYRTMSVLAVPMVNWRGETIGVIQLINRKTDPKIKLEDPETCVEYIQPFTDHDIGIATSIASQASIAIQNTQLVDSIKGLFNGFIAASVKAIESRDPTTGGHSQRVAELTVALAEQVTRSKKARFKNINFSEVMLEEIRYASLLHDFGKIGVRENVLVKAKKLYPYELQAVQDRFEIIRRTVDAEFLANKIKLLSDNKSGAEPKSLVAQTDQEREQAQDEISNYLQFILQCNEPTVLAQGGFEQLNNIAEQLYKNWEGETAAFLNDKELVSLSVPRGSLNENDRKEIESHVTHTYKFLSTIPWTPELRRVPEIAYAHHEKLDGTGYPNKLKSEEIPIQAKMMTVADIFDALTASDRPYKKAMPAERALNILHEEAKSSHIDPDLLEIFIDSDTYKIVL
ncbi:MAG: GAF domain-containing protein, partial [SAR324 cluster bacterium]|nr:GAF domain-containing protein [SAR324 cluster bacterium]